MNASHLPRLCFGLMLAALSGTALADSPLHIYVTPLFEGINPISGVSPMMVEVQNTGPNAVGAVVVDSGNGSVSYPVELPQGASKRLTIYPDLGNYSINPTQFTLDTDRGQVQTEYQPKYNGNAVGPGDTVIGMIAETSGDLGFLKSVSGFPNRARDAYLKPADAPGRPVAYSRLSALFLGSGAERISNDAVKALKNWVLGGGVIVFTGGASSPVLNDQRWADVMPVHNASPQNISGQNALSHGYQTATPEFTAMLGQPVEGASPRVGGMIIEKQVGLGRTIYLAVNPFEAPLRSWPARGQLFLGLLSPSALGSSKLVTASVLQQERDFTRYASGFGVPGRAYPSGIANNPFEAKLPPTRTVLLILLTFFVAVVPLNFLLLRKMRRGEWAWATAPILSVGFAAVFFASARDLYGAGMATSTDALLISQEGLDGSYVLGKTQMFFPRGGSYDLGLSGVDMFSKDNPEDMPYYSGSNTQSQIDALDTGEIKAVARVPNLAFREIYYRQAVPAGDWFRVEKVGAKTFRVTNNSPYKLSAPRLLSSGFSTPFTDLAPKEARDVVYRWEADDEGMTGQFSRMLGRSGNLGLTGALEGFRVGPQIGKEAPSKFGVRLAFVTDLKVPGKQ